MLEKNFNFAEAEKRLYEAWEQSDAFKPSGEGEPFTIVIPPPNVTGSLHMGHALNNTLQDVLCRFERMRGRSVLWQPGMDHAGIATQMVVERQMTERQEPKRTEIGREKFVEKVWAWKEESGGAIINQLKRLGATCDWSRERFTMDEGLSEAVVKVFVQLYEEGLIYRDKRLVNWDPKFETAISDLEVENSEVDGHFWHFKYPLENGETYEFPIEHDEAGEPTKYETRDYISIATTRPETMLGDGAVAVHPSDKRYAPIVGKMCLLPLADRYIPIITDDYPDPEFGSGAVKITGAHDFNDYQVAKRNDIKLYPLFDTKAAMLHEDYIPEKYRGLDRFEARTAIVEDIEERGLLIDVEDKKIMQPSGDRSGVVIEPMLTDQWFVNAEELAKPAITAVEEGATKFVPENWSKTYFQWMRNIEPWCVSRQLWWGHRIPAWYGPIREGIDDKEPIFVAATEQAAKAQAVAFYNTPVEIADDLVDAALVLENEKLTKIWRESDVLDTWFSSALWPFSTLGWPDESPELAKHYPNSVLVTAHDIIFFWVARMMMMGLYCRKQIPFPEVYIHGLVVDEHGQKMSKSKGNGVDPLDLIEKFGADALRFTLAVQAAQGRNVRISEPRVEGYRNFGTKLWNAARFCEMNECVVDPAFDPATVTQTVNKWIIHEANSCALTVTRELEAYRFNDAAGAIYKFSWNIFCDWYLEFAKPVFGGDDDQAAKAETRATAAWVLDQILKLLHPFMPFISEEIWSNLSTRRVVQLADSVVSDSTALITSDWPHFDPKPSQIEAATEMNWAIGLISEIRSTRIEANIPAGAEVEIIVVSDDATVKSAIFSLTNYIMRLARISGLSFEPEPPKGAVQIIYKGSTYAIPLAGIVDVDAERGRLDKEIAKLKKEISGIDNKLANKNFVDKAPPEVVAEQHTRRADFETQIEKFDAALARLADL